MKNSDMPAMPQTGIIDSSGDFCDCSDMGGEGFTKRETIAMAAMQGLLVNAGRNGFEFQTVCDEAVKQADALLAALEENKS
jgi:hypothetical protein